MSLAIKVLDEEIIRIDESIKHFDSTIATYKKQIKDMEKSRELCVKERKEIIDAISDLGGKV